MKERWKDLLAEFGKFALIIYFSLFGATLFGFFVAIKAGLDLGDWTGGRAGTLAAAWVATKITQPVRILITLALTPIIATAVRKLRRPSVDASENPEPPAPDSDQPDDDESE